MGTEEIGDALSEILGVTSEEVSDAVGEVQAEWSEAFGDVSNITIDPYIDGDVSE